MRKRQSVGKNILGNLNSRGLGMCMAVGAFVLEVLDITRTCPPTSGRGGEGILTVVLDSRTVDWWMVPDWA